MKQLNKIIGLILFALFLAFTSSRAVACENVDLDLTRMSGTMVYSAVVNIVNAPADYAGKTIKMTGTYTVYPIGDGSILHACLVRDAAGCCANGFEFRLAYPQAYPPEDCEITLIGTLALEETGNAPIPFLKDAEFVEPAG